jgi:hypothetical protein
MLMYESKFSGAAHICSFFLETTCFLPYGLSRGSSLNPISFSLTVKALVLLTFALI